MRRFLSAAYGQLVPNLGGQRSGISSYQFLKIGGDARGAAMSEAVIAVTNDASAIFWNPAGLANSVNDQVIVSHAEWLVDVQHEFAAASYHLDPGNIIGFSFISLHTDPMKVTTEYQPGRNREVLQLQRYRCRRYLCTEDDRSVQFRCHRESMSAKPSQNSIRMRS
jgi:hypothetical protein